MSVKIQKCKYCKAEMKQSEYFKNKKFVIMRLTCEICSKNKEAIK
jgi:hypothetical protein